MTLATAVYGVGIKSIQAGTITISNPNTSNTATISSVNTSKSVVFYGGRRGQPTDNASSASTVVLTNATTVTAARYGTDQSVIVSYTVVEFN